MFPKSDEVAKAKERLKQIDRQGVGRAKAPVAVPAPPVSFTAEKAPEEPSSGLRRDGRTPLVGASYMRIVIGIDGEAKFDSVGFPIRTASWWMLRTSHLSSDLGARTFPVEDGFLRQIRVAQFSPTVARVVLDVEKIEDYSIFSLPNPFRLVIDVQGSAPTQIAHATQPAPVIGADARQRQGQSVRRLEPRDHNARRGHRRRAALTHRLRQDWRGEGSRHSPRR